MAEIKKYKKFGIALALGYFKIAQLGLGEILQQKNIGKCSSVLFRGHNNYNPPFTLESGSLLLAVRYNFKHALELSMKSLLHLSGGGFSGTHDLVRLCNELGVLAGKDILRSTFIAWEWLVHKYSKDDAFSAGDTRNELDRYMVSMSGESVFPYEDIHALSKKDLRGMRRDIQTAKELFWKMDGERGFVQSCQRMGKDPERYSKQVRKTVIVKTASGGYFTRRKPRVVKPRQER